MPPKKVTTAKLVKRTARKGTVNRLLQDDAKEKEQQQQKQQQKQNVSTQDRDTQELLSDLMHAPLNEKPIMLAASQQQQQHSDSLKLVSQSPALSLDTSVNNNNNNNSEKASLAAAVPASQSEDDDDDQRANPEIPKKMAGTRRQRAVTFEGGEKEDDDNAREASEDAAAPVVAKVVVKKKPVGKIRGRMVTTAAPAAMAKRSKGDDSGEDESGARAQQPEQQPQPQQPQVQQHEQQPAAEETTAKKRAPLLPPTREADIPLFRQTQSANDAAVAAPSQKQQSQGQQSQQPAASIIATPVPVARTPVQELFDETSSSRRLWFGAPNPVAMAEMASLSVIQQHPMHGHQNAGMVRFAAVVTEHARRTSLMLRSRAEQTLRQLRAKHQLAVESKK